MAWDTDSIMDRLDKKITAQKAETADNEEIMVPRKCAYCRTNVVCSVLPTFIGLSKVGIIVGVEDCPYSIPNKATQAQKE